MLSPASGVTLCCRLFDHSEVKVVVYHCLSAWTGLSEIGKNRLILYAVIIIFLHEVVLKKHLQARACLYCKPDLLRIGRLRLKKCVLCISLPNNIIL